MWMLYSIVYCLIVNITSPVTLIWLNIFERDETIKQVWMPITGLHHCLSLIINITSSVTLILLNFFEREETIICECFTWVS